MINYIINIINIISVPNPIYKTLLTMKYRLILVMLPDWTVVICSIFDLNLQVTRLIRIIQWRVIVIKHSVFTHETFLIGKFHTCRVIVAIRSHRGLWS